jgi:hypothetical protein
MKSFKTALLLFVLASSACDVKTGDQDVIPQPIKPAKDATHVNFVQCRDSEQEVLTDVTLSDLENQSLENGVISVRSLSPAGSAYTSVTTNQMTVVTWGTIDDPGIRQFQLSVKQGPGIVISTYDFKTGSANYSPTPDEEPLPLQCTFSVAKPSPLQ